MDTKTTLPSERDIRELEHRLSEMKRVRDNARREVMSVIKDENLLDSLSSTEALAIITRLQHKIKGGHVNRRGSPVSPELKSNLESAIKQGHMTLAEMSKMFNLSVSYISRVKRDLKNAGEIVGYDAPIQNVYQDKPLTHHKKEAAA